MEVAEGDVVGDGSRTTLPDDVLVEIFSLLPDKYLLRCKLLSKHFYFLLSQIICCMVKKPPSVIALFIRTKYNDVEDEEHQRIYRYPDLLYLPDYFTMDYIRMKCAQGVVITRYVSLETLRHLPILGWEDDHLISSYGLPFRPVPDELLGSCNGLLLFLDMDSSRYYVSNPSTRQSVPIPLPPFEQKKYLYAALAFDPSRSMTSYKVVRFEWLCNHPTIILDVYSSATRSWSRQELTVDPRLRRHVWLKPVVYFGGAFFRLSRTWHLIRFGLEEEKVSMDVIDLPLTSKQCNRLMGCMGVFMGRFCYANEISKVIYVWSLEEESDDVGRWWNLKHKINIYDMTSDILLNRANAPDICQWVGPIAFDPSSNVVYMGSSLAILRCNLEDNSLEEVARVDDYNIFVPGCYCPALTYARFLVPFNATGDIRIRTFNNYNCSFGVSSF